MKQPCQTLTYDWREVEIGSSETEQTRLKLLIITRWVPRQRLFSSNQNLIQKFLLYCLWCSTRLGLGCFQSYKKNLISSQESSVLVDFQLLGKMFCWGMNVLRTLRDSRHKHHQMSTFCLETPRGLDCDSNFMFCLERLKISNV